MSPIVPAIIPKSFSELKSTCDSILRFTHDIQVDIVDGSFVPFKSWPYGEDDDISDLKQLTETFLIEMDLMIDRPEETVESYLQTGARRIVVHIESTDKIKEIHDLKSKYDFRLGLSLNNDTALEKLDDIIEYADYIQCMGIKEIGSQGQPFDTRVLSRIKELKEKFPDLVVSVDGSVNFDTVSEISKAGADRCAVGSAILKSEDMNKAYNLMIRKYTEA